MNFKYSAYIDTIDGDLDTYLKKLGYEFIITGYEDDSDRYTLIANGFVSYHKEEPTLEMASGHKSYDNFTCIELVNCIGNPPLFKAVSAMREDSDYMQWFTDGKEWFLCKRDEFRGYSEFSNSYPEFWGYNYHKAPLTELQKRFKKKDEE